jgi:hypothetical protein
MTITDYQTLYQQARAAAEAEARATEQQRQAKLLSEFESHVKASLGESLPLFQVGEFSIKQRGGRYELSAPVMIMGLNGNFEQVIYGGDWSRGEPCLSIGPAQLRLPHIQNYTKSEGYIYTPQPIDNQALGGFFTRLEEYQTALVKKEREGLFWKAWHECDELKDEAEFLSRVECINADYPEFTDELRTQAGYSLNIRRDNAKSEAALAQAQAEAEVKLTAAREQAAAAWFPYRVYRIKYGALAIRDDEFEVLTEYLYSSTHAPDGLGWWLELKHGNAIRCVIPHPLLIQQIDVTNPDSEAARATCTHQSIYIGHGHGHVDILTPPPGVERIEVEQEAQS